MHEWPPFSVATQDNTSITRRQNRRYRSFLERGWITLRFSTHLKSMHYSNEDGKTNTFYCTTYSSVGTQGKTFQPYQVNKGENEGPEGSTQFSCSCLKKLNGLARNIGLEGFGERSRVEGQCLNRQKKNIDGEKGHSPLNSFITIR